MADHNDPNSVNSIFSDIDPSPADLYDMFGYPGPDDENKTVVLASTFAPVPATGTLDPDLLYRMLVNARPRSGGWPHGFDLGGLEKYVAGVKDRLASTVHNGDIRAWVDGHDTAYLTLTGFPGGDISASVPTNTVSTITAPGGHEITAFVGGRDDAFFNDLPGFFRSINYAPQFYHVPHDSPAELREVPIPKTLLELDGNKHFNFDPAQPNWGHGEKRDLPNEPMVWTGDRFAKDENGNYRLVYSGKDAQAGRNVNAVVLEIPLAYLTDDPAGERVVDVWAESWVRKATGKVPLIPDDPAWIEHPTRFLSEAHRDRQLRDYKRVDTTAQPFADAALNERDDDRQVGGPNFMLAAHFVKRLAHLGWGFGPSVTALGLPCSFDHDNSPVSVHKVHRHPDHGVPAGPEGDLPGTAHARRQLEPEKTRHPAAPARANLHPEPLLDRHRHNRHLAVRPSAGRPSRDQVPVDVPGHGRAGRRRADTHRDAQRPGPVGVRTVVPKTPPNPLSNDAEFLKVFPYLAEPW